MIGKSLAKKTPTSNIQVIYLPNKFSKGNSKPNNTSIESPRVVITARMPVRDRKLHIALFSATEKGKKNCNKSRTSCPQIKKTLDYHQLKPEISHRQFAFRSERRYLII